MDNANPEPGDLEQELRSLGQNLGAVFRAAWESEDRRRIQGEIETGLNEAAAALQSAADEFGRSEAGQQLKQDVRDLGDRIQSGELPSKVREDLLQVLRTVNAELNRAGQEMAGRADASAPPEEGAP
ncbi:MAG TPA: hypothetical protein VLL77_07380 [Anaerolineales bacterium]|nr:hypothetical protein [Anaerolineales bacterium]